MVSINDVAARAGVSPTTVSHTVSGKRRVSPAVQERVRKAMEELGYSPSRSAQSLANGRTRIIGLIVPDISNNFFAELAKGVEETAMASGYNVILCTTGFDHERELLYLEMIRSRAVDGIVYAAGAPPSDRDLRRLLGDLPLVLADEEVPGAEVTAFVSDNVRGGRLAAEHLLDLGHRTCLVVAANGELVTSADRVAGFTGAWRAGGGGELRVVSGGFTDHGAREAIKPIIAGRVDDGFTAVFAVNDLMALGTIEVLREFGVDVPADVSVVGFDDIFPARCTHPALTTVRQDATTMGSAAAGALVAALEGDATLDRVRHVLPVELVPRASTAPAAARTTEEVD